MIFDLVHDYSAALTAMPKDHARHRTLSLLEKAIRRDIHFIDRHPTTLFQCMWNTCWWCSPISEQEQSSTQSASAMLLMCSGNSRLQLRKVLEIWHEAKTVVTPSFYWIRSLLPPPDPIEGPLAGIVTHSDGIRWLATSSNGDDVIALDKNEHCNVYCAESLRMLQSFSINDGELGVIYCIGVNHLMVGSEDGCVRTVDVTTGSLVDFSCLPDRRTIFVEAASPDGTRVVISTMTGERYLWNLTRQDSIAKLPTEQDVGSRIVMSPDGKFVAVGSANGSLSIFDCNNGQKTQSVKAHLGWVGALAISPDCGIVASGGYDGNIVLWDIRNGSLLSFDTQLEIVRCLAFSPSGLFLASGSDDYMARVWSISTATQIWGVRAHDANLFNSFRNESAMRGITFGVDENILFTGGYEDGMLKKWDLSISHVAETPNLKSSPYWRISSVGFSPDWQQVICGRANNTISVWDAETGQLMKSVKGKKGITSVTANFPDMRIRLKTSGSESALLDRKTVLGWLPIKPSNHESDPSARTWAVKVQHNRFYIFRLEGPKEHLDKLAFLPLPGETLAGTPLQQL